MRIYKGDGDPYNKSINRKTFRTKQTVTFNPDTGALDNAIDQNDSVRYRLPNLFENLFVDYRKLPGVWYGGRYYVEDARQKADASRITAKVIGSDGCITLHLKANVSDPLGPTGIEYVAAVDYHMEVEFTKSDRGWKARARANSDSFSSYLYFSSNSLLWFHNALNESPIGMVGNGNDIKWEWKDL